jgi:hypothetical protein
MNVNSYRDPLAPDVEVSTRDQWISQEAYSEVVQKSIVPCTDVVFLNKKEKVLYLGKRSVLPMKGIWFMGGRMFFNDRSPQESIARCVEMETGVRIKLERFEFICTNLYSWIKVAQGDFPGKNLGLTYGCDITAAEVEQISHGLSATEYDKEFGLQRFDRARLVDAKVHPAIIDIYDQLFPK